MTIIKTNCERISGMTKNICLAVAAAASAWVPAIADNAPAPQPEKKVFAHYMTCFSASPDFYRREIALAQRYAIDGFALNCGEWKKPVKDNKTIDTRYIANANRIFQAAQDLNTGFKLFMSPDFACIPAKEWQRYGVDDMFTRYYKHPNLFRYRNKAFFSGYSGRPEQYTPIAEQLRRDGYDFLLVPNTGRNFHPMAWSLETVLSYFRPGNKLDGVFCFTCDGTVNDLIDNNANGRRGTLFADKIYMAGAVPAYNSPNLRDFRGMAGYCSIWEGIIRDQADLVEIVTWNDYQEDSNLMPYRWRSELGKFPCEKAYYNRDESYLDVTSYYASAFKTGDLPQITQDRLYFSYRARQRTRTTVWDDKLRQWVDIRFCQYPYDQIHDDVRDAVYVTAFLTAPAELTIVQGQEQKKVSLPAGVSSCEMPMQPGVPRLLLKRDGNEIINVFGRKTIVDKPTQTNSVKGYHLAYRTWTSGAAAGQPTVSLKPSTPVEIGEKGRQELALTVAQLGDKTYNFRLTYRNTGDEEARLTLYADGAPGADGAQPYYFPLFLPSTGNEFRTVSFLWSAWAGTSKLTMRCDRNDNPKLTALGFNDSGTITFKQLDLIPLIPFQAGKPSSLPVMVEIPGGEFVMGGDGGEPDEAPAHRVKLSPFALGKYEVTNAEFERFMPEHKQRRDGYSWRDREPVIYVSWTDAVRYCNWLSKQHGLNPVYDEKTWAADLKADGFRLPTEAEWEYAASGRDENRLYPWGNQLPGPGLGNFESARSLSIAPQRTSSTGGGVEIVGDYPLGAGRGGLMDLAGNVAEWCSDAYLPYTADAVTDPCVQGKSPHRVIRGGSWGYYNRSQRCRDREFNNSGYPGYIYLGFRVALSDAGYRKLNRK